MITGFGALVCPVLLWAGIASAGQLTVVNGAGTIGDHGLRITAGPTCNVNDVVVSGPTVSGDQLACDTISTSGSVTVSGTATFTAGDRVSLGAGFRVPAGATFRADADPFVDSPYAFITDHNPASETTYNARFDLNTDALNLAVGEDIDHFTGLSADDTVQFRVILRDSGSGRSLVLAARSGGVLVEHPVPLNLESGFNNVFLEWTSSAGDGRFQATLNGGTAQGLNSLSNSSGRIDTVRWGLVDGPAVVTTGGSIDIDDFISFR